MLFAVAEADRLYNIRYMHRSAHMRMLPFRQCFHTGGFIFLSILLYTKFAD